MALLENVLVRFLVDLAIRLVYLPNWIENLDIFTGLLSEIFSAFDDHWGDLVLFFVVLILLWGNLVLIGCVWFYLVERAHWVEAWDLKAELGLFGNSNIITDFMAGFRGMCGNHFVDFVLDQAHFLGHLSSSFLHGLDEGVVVLGRHMKIFINFIINWL